MALTAALLPAAVQDALRHRLTRQPTRGSKVTKTTPELVAAG
jgi:hypothetical protein